MSLSQNNKAGLSLKKSLRTPRTLRFKLDPGWIVAAILPLIGILAASGPDVIDAADAPYHVHRIYTLALMLKEGNLWPRWIPYYHLGYGYPIFIFYPSGVSYLGGILVLLFGIRAALAFNIVSALAWMIGCTGMYGLARRLLPAPGAILAAMLWAYAPSRLHEVWYQGGLAQMMAAALVPWLFYGLLLTAQAPTRRHALMISFALAGIVLTHVPMAYIAGLYAGLAALMLPAWEARHDRRTYPRRLSYLAAGLLLGAGLAAIFALPMVLELKYVRASREHVETISYLKTRFVLLRDVFSQPRPLDLTDLNLRAPISLGLVGSLLGAVGLLALVIRRRFALVVLLLVAVTTVVFMMLSESLDVWLTIPYFRQIRFPERLLRFGSIWLALLGGASVLIIPDRFAKRWRLRSLTITLPLVLIAALPMIYGTNAYVKFGHLTALDEIIFERDDKIWGTTSYDEYDPIWGERIPYPKTIPNPDAYITDPLRITAIESSGLHIEQIDTAKIRLTADAALPVSFHQYYYPGWRVTLDGHTVRAYPEDHYGLLTIDLPPGEHIVTVTYSGTTAQKTGTAITLLSLGLVFFSLFPFKKPLRPLRLSGENIFPRRAALIIITAIIGFSLVNELYIAPHTLWFRHRSPPDDPVYMEHAVHQPFSDVFELLGYTLDTDTVAPGDTFRITLFWRPLHEITDDHRTRVQLVNLPVTEAWAVSEPPFPHGAVGYTPDRFASDVHDLTVYNWVPSYVGLISVQIVRESDNAVIPLPDGSDRLLLPVPIRVSGSGPAAARALNYRLGGTVELRCASIEPSGDQLDIALYWHVTHSPNQDLTVFVHGLDADGNLIAQNDAPAMGPNYPAHFWRTGQNLVDHHTLPADPAMTQIAIGLYTPDARLPVTQDGQPVPGDRILIPIGAQSCAN